MTTSRDLSGIIRQRKDLVAEGLTDNNIAHLVREGVLARVRRGSYALQSQVADFTNEDKHRLLARAVLRTAHPSTVLSHASSVIERGVSLWGVPLGVVHTTQLERARAGRRTPDWHPHRSVLDLAETDEINGVRATKAARAALEFTTIAGAEASLIAVNGLLRAGAMTKEEFAAEVKNCKYWPNTLTANLVLHLADPRLQSVAEDRFAFLCHRQGLPRPEPQVEILDEFGNVFAYVDFAWEPLETFLEVDGLAKYFLYRREDETLQDYLLREKQRQEKICQITGWTCIRVTWEDLAQPELLATRIRKILVHKGLTDRGLPPQGPSAYDEAI